MEDEKKLRTTIRYLIMFFLFAIIVSGLTTFPIETELKLMNEYIAVFPPFLREWLRLVYQAVHEVNAKYPFLSYGSDWLAFAHLVIAIAFIGPLKDPLKNIWVIEWGMICCVSVLPLAIIAGHIREVPLTWRLVDSSFGIIGFLLLYIGYKKIQKLKSITLKIENTTSVKLQ